MRPFHDESGKPLVRFAFGVADGWHERLSEAEREQLKHELHKRFFPRRRKDDKASDAQEGNTLPWGYLSTEELEALVPKWFKGVNKILGENLYVDLSTTSPRRCWYVGGEWHWCIHAPVFVSKGRVHRRWTVEIETPDGKKEVPISFRASILSWVEETLPCPEWRHQLFKIVQEAPNFEQASAQLEEILK